MKKQSEVIQNTGEATHLDKESLLAEAMVQVLDARQALAIAEAKVEQLMKKFDPKIVARVQRRIRY